MTAAVWFVVAGALLVSLAVVGSALKRLPLSAAMLYLAVGAALGPAGVGLLAVGGDLRPRRYDP